LARGPGQLIIAEIKEFAVQGNPRNHTGNAALPPTRAGKEVSL
jgi:hypothetical protein